MENPGLPKRGRGRPRAFDRETALEKAMQLFWARGFEGASMSELTEAMGISPSSLYSSFGDKESLFQAAVDHYQEGPGAYAQRALESEPTARRAFQRLFQVAAEELSKPERPAGCMVALAVTQCSPASQPVQRAMHDLRDRSLEALTARLRQGQEDGEFTAPVDVEELAIFYTAVFHGMSIQARDGAGKERLLSIGRLAMRAWPD